MRLMPEGRGMGSLRESQHSATCKIPNSLFLVIFSDECRPCSCAGFVGRGDRTSSVSFCWISPGYSNSDRRVWECNHVKYVLLQLVSEPGMARLSEWNFTLREYTAVTPRVSVWHGKKTASDWGEKNVQKPRKKFNCLVNQKKISSHGGLIPQSQSLNPASGHQLSPW